MPYRRFAAHHVYTNARSAHLCVVERAASNKDHTYETQIYLDVCHLGRRCRAGALDRFGRALPPPSAPGVPLRPPPPSFLPLGLLILRKAAYGPLFPGLLTEAAQAIAPSKGIPRAEHATLSRKVEIATPKEAIVPTSGVAKATR